MRSRPTILDVAARAGVSRQTVSRVINGKGEVGAATRERVLAAIAELGYRPNAVAQSMVAGRTHTLGCISPNLTDYTFACLIDNAQSEARQHGYFLLTGSAPTVDDVPLLLEELLARQVDGLLILNPCADGRSRHVSPLLQRGMAVVYLSESPRGEAVSSVRCNDHEGGLRATRYLLELGHTQIAMIAGPGNEQCTHELQAGYCQALAESGLSADPSLQDRGDWSATSGYEATQRLLAAGRPFSALFAQNDRMAVGAIRALRENGLRVPQDISVIGFDDYPLSSYFDPPLTTLRQPLDYLGRQAARLLIETIHDPNHAIEQILFPARLVERASCAPRRV